MLFLQPWTKLWKPWAEINLFSFKMQVSGILCQEEKMDYYFNYCIQYVDNHMKKYYNTEVPIRILFSCIFTALSLNFHQVLWHLLLMHLTFSKSFSTPIHSKPRRFLLYYVYKLLLDVAPQITPISYTESMYCSPNPPVMLLACCSLLSPGEHRPVFYCLWCWHGICRADTGPRADSWHHQ